MAERTARTPDELRAASAHLHYEVIMFDTTARTLMSGVFGDGVAKNAFLESFAVHTRILKEFFHPSGAKENAVLAEHYFDDRMRWLRVRHGLPKALDVGRRVGTEIAHLTYDRLDVSPEAKNWNVPEIWKAMMQVVRTFVQNVPHQSLAPIWQGAPTGDSPAAGSAAPLTPASATNAVTMKTMVNTPSANSQVTPPPTRSR